MKKLSLQIFALTILFISQTVGQSFNYPEAVVFDYENMRWLVSSYEGGRILQLDLDGNLAYFNEANLDHPRGMKIMNDVLYVTASTEIKGFSLVSGLEVFNLFIPGVTFLNDVESDDEGYLYVSESSTGNIYKVYLSSSNYSIFANGYAINGLLLDKANNRLLSCHWFENAPIKATDLSDSTVSTIVNTGLADLDGLARNAKGDIFVSSQGSNAIYRYDPDFINEPVFIAGGFNNICDIFIEPNSDLIAAANMSGQSIEFVTSQMGGNLINIPGDQSTIQAAIDIAEDGDLILVNSGTYFENLNFKGKNVNLSSRYIFNNDTEFIDNTIIDGSNPIHPDTASCVLFINGETEMATIQGFTITGGMGTKWDDEHGAGLFTEGGGILVQYASPTIKSNKIIFNYAINTNGTVSAGGGGIRCGDSNPLIQNNVIVYNHGRYGAGIVLNYSGAIIRNNIINHNSGGEDFGGGGIWSYGISTDPKIFQNNTITNNHSETGGGGIRLWSSSAEVSNSIIWSNTGNSSPQIQGNDGIFSYCDIQGGWPGIQNIDADPIFDTLNFYLIPGSPCIDAGNPDIDLNDPEDPFNLGQAAFPSMGSLSNDMGAYGGPHRQTLVEYTVISQSCLPEGITFSTQAEIDSFQINYPYCTEIEGDVTINGSEITNLNGLNVLTSIGGTLNLTDNFDLTNLSGLEGLINIGGDLIFYFNSGLTSITGLSNLTSLGGDFRMSYSESLIGLSGLEGLTTIGGGLYLMRNYSLNSLSGLDNLTTIGGNLQLFQNQPLTNLTGFEGLTSINGGISIQGPLNNLSGLDNLTSINGHLTIGGHPIYGNGSLTSISGLENIDAGTITGITIYNNPILSNCHIQSICDFLSVPNDSIDIYDNATGCNSHQEVEEACWTSVDENSIDNRIIICPSPIESDAIITYTLNQSSPVTLKILDLSGQEMIILVNEFQQQGEQSLIFNSESLRPGIYFCVLKTSEGVQTRKIIKL